MINLFLRAKHWQLFLLTFGVMVIGYGTIMYFFISNIMSVTMAGGQPDPMAMFRFMKFLPVLIIFVMLVMMGWNWSVVFGLREKLPASVTLNTNLFKVFLIVPLVYTLAFLVFMAVMFNQISDVAAGNGSPDNIGLSVFAVFPVILPLHLFSIFCVFYNMYFVAKMIKTVELQRAVTFGDFVGEFFLIWFYFIGVWILQPRINAFHEGRSMNSGYTGTDSSNILDETIRS